MKTPGSPLLSHPVTLNAVIINVTAWVTRRNSPGIMRLNARCMYQVPFHRRTRGAENASRSSRRYRGSVEGNGTQQLELIATLQRLKSLAPIIPGKVMFEAFTREMTCLRHGRGG